MATKAWDVREVCAEDLYGEKLPITIEVPSHLSDGANFASYVGVLTDVQIVTERGRGRMIYVVSGGKIARIAPLDPIRILKEKK